MARALEATPRNGAIRSQYEVARLLGISRGRVNELERSAMKKLRKGLRDWAPVWSKEGCSK